MAKVRILELVKELRPVSSVNPEEPCMQQVEKVPPAIILDQTPYLRTLEMVVMELVVALNLPQAARASLSFVIRGGLHNGKINGTYRKRRSYQCSVVFRYRA